MVTKWMRQAVASDPDDVVTELLGIRPGHDDILPARPSRASQLRCHPFMQQTRDVVASGLLAGGAQDAGDGPLDEQFLLAEHELQLAHASDRVMAARQHLHLTVA